MNEISLVPNLFADRKEVKRVKNRPHLGMQRNYDASKSTARHKLDHSLPVFPQVLNRDNQGRSSDLSAFYRLPILKKQ
jgi:hypothetical protein